MDGGKAKMPISKEEFVNDKADRGRGYKGRDYYSEG